MTQFAQCLRFYLADTLTRHVELFSDLFKRAGETVGQVIELKFVCSKATWNLYATCVIQGADCGIYISMVRLLYCYSELKKKKQSENAEPK